MNYDCSEDVAWVNKLLKMVIEEFTFEQFCSIKTTGQVEYEIKKYVESNVARKIEQIRTPTNPFRYNELYDTHHELFDCSYYGLKSIVQNNTFAKYLPSIRKIYRTTFSDNDYIPFSESIRCVGGKQGPAGMVGYGGPDSRIMKGNIYTINGLVKI